MMELKCDFSKASMEDRVWSITKGWGTITSIGGARYPIAVKFDYDDRVDSYDRRGFNNMLDQGPEIFWNEIHFDIPEPPKRMVKKTVEFWMEFDGEGKIKDCAFKPECAEFLGKNGNIVRHYTDTIEIEE